MPRWSAGSAAAPGFLSLLAVLVSGVMGCVIMCASGLQEVGGSTTDVHTASACNDVDSCC